jgi:gas vesicle protein
VSKRTRLGGLSLGLLLGVVAGWVAGLLRTPRKPAP